MRTINSIIFDLDSTLVTIEGLDWLASKKKIETRVARLTKLSMEGKLDMNEAMRAKMALLSPNKRDTISLGEKYCDSLVPGVLSVIDTFHQLGKEVWILTGNFRPAVEIKAKIIGIPTKRIIANTIYFDKNGNYKGFDAGSLLAKNGGKAKIIQKLCKTRHRIAYIGDGIVDLEVQEIVDVFVGFGGAVTRDRVKNESQYFISEMNMLPLLDIVLTKNEKSRVSTL